MPNLLEQLDVAARTFNSNLPGNNSNSNYSNQNSNNQFRVKQEPKLSVQKKNLQNRINRAKNQNPTFGKPNKPTNNQKACYFCGKDYSPNHKS